MKKLATAGVCIALALTATGCSEWNDEHGKGDAPVAEKRGEDSPKAVTNNPDGFGNVATGCVNGSKGWRYFVTTNTSGPSNLVVKEDASC